MRTAYQSSIIIAFVLMSLCTFALENTIYMSVASKAGQFPNADYQLNQYSISFKDNWLLINGHKVIKTTDKKVIELFVSKNSIYLVIDNYFKIIPKL